MIIRNLFRARNQIPSSSMTPTQFVTGVELDMGGDSVSGQNVTAENCKNIATAYRCIDIICSDYAKLPEQVFINRGLGQIDRMRPDSRQQNVAWLLERKPNRWMTPMKFKRMRMGWLLTHGASYVWRPPASLGQRREIFILPSDRTLPIFDRNGNLFYQTTFSSGEVRFLPYVEVMTLLLNSMDGITGRGVISYARETLGRLIGANVTKGKFYKHGLNPGGAIWMNGELNPEARKKAKREFASEMSGADNAYALAVFDAKIAKFEQITMHPMDAGFLGSIEQDELAIANFFNMPLYKLNMGKQAYSSNEQQNLEYLASCLDAFLVQTEEVDIDGLLSEMEQETTYIRFNRDALLRTDAKTRAEVHEIRIRSGQETPNEGRQIEDQSSFKGGDSHYYAGNMGRIAEDGAIQMASAPATGGKV